VGIQQEPAGYHKKFNLKNNWQFLCHVKPWGVTEFGPALSSASWRICSSKAHSQGLYSTLQCASQKCEKYDMFLSSKSSIQLLQTQPPCPWNSLGAVPVTNNRQCLWTCSNYFKNRIWQPRFEHLRITIFEKKSKRVQHTHFASIVII
jgi:hypothetical protein